MSDSPFPLTALGAGADCGAAGAIMPPKRSSEAAGAGAAGADPYKSNSPGTW